MSIQPLPNTITDLTPELLTSALSHSPHWHEGAVRSVSFEPLESAGGSVYRASVDLVTDRSAELLVKLHNPETPIEARRGREEVYFYSEIGSKSGVSVPETYVSEREAETGRMLIVQELLSGGRVGTPSTMLSQHDQERVLASLAVMHARWWNSPGLERFHGIRNAKEMLQSRIDSVNGGTLSVTRFLERFGAIIDPVISSYYRRLAGINVPEQLQDGFSPHLTLCHYDVAAKNIFLPDDESREPVFFDWELVIKGNVGHELAQFLSASTDPREHDRLIPMLRYYHDRLTQNGVSDYEFDTLWSDFRYGCIARLAAPIALTERGNTEADRLAMTLLPLVSSTAISTGAIDLLKR
jgi:hypothetical protein